ASPAKLARSTQTIKPLTSRNATRDFRSGRYPSAITRRRSRRAIRHQARAAQTTQTGRDVSPARPTPRSALRHGRRPATGGRGARRVPAPRLSVRPLAGCPRRASAPHSADRRDPAAIHIPGGDAAPCKITTYEAFMGRQPWQADSRSWRPAHAAEWLFPVASYIEIPTHPSQNNDDTRITTAA